LSTSLSIGAIGTALVHPLDLIKTRVQIRAEGVGIRQYGIQAGYNPH